MKKILFCIITLLILSNCAKNNVTKNGYSIDKKDIGQIKVGISNKESVLNLLDYPTNIYPMNPNKWVYCSYKTKKLMFFRPKIIEQDVVIINFDDESLVQNIAQYDLSDSTNISLNSRKTQIENREEGLIKDIFNNIGSVTPGF